MGQKTKRSKLHDAEYWINIIEKLVENGMQKKLIQGERLTPEEAHSIGIETEEEIITGGVVGRIKQGILTTNSGQRNRLLTIGVLKQKHVDKLIELDAEREASRKGPKILEHLEMFRELDANGVDLSKVKQKDVISIEDAKKMGIEASEPILIGQIKKSIQQGFVKINDDDLRQELVDLGILGETHVKKLKGEETRKTKNNIYYWLPIIDKVYNEGRLEEIMHSKRGTEDFKILRVIRDIRCGSIKIKDEKIKQHLIDIGVYIEDRKKFKLERTIDLLEKYIKSEKTVTLDTVITVDEAKKLGVEIKNDLVVKDIVKSIKQKEVKSTTEQVEWFEKHNLMDLEIKRKTIRRFDEWFDILDVLHKKGIKLDRRTKISVEEAKELEIETTEDLLVGSYLNYLWSGKVELDDTQKSQLRKIGLLTDTQEAKIEGTLAREPKHDINFWLTVIKKLYDNKILNKVIKIGALTDEEKSRLGITVTAEQIVKAIDNIYGMHIITTLDQRSYLYSVGALSEEKLKRLNGRYEKKAMESMKKSVAEHVGDNERTRELLMNELARASTHDKGIEK
ncbi:MAG: hypothetical protein IJS47_06540 [Clostridia bacterium]|nr:hypothetical protein [Clostridia bacterium]